MWTQVRLHSHICAYICVHIHMNTYTCIQNTHRGRGSRQAYRQADKDRNQPRKPHLSQSGTSSSHMLGGEQWCDQLPLKSCMVPQEPMSSLQRRKGASRGHGLQVCLGTLSSTILRDRGIPGSPIPTRMLLVASGRNPIKMQ